MLLERYLGPRIGVGSLELEHPDGTRQRFGSGEPRAVMRLHRRRTLRRILLDPEFMLGQTYMDGDWSPGEGGVLRVLEVLVRNFPPRRGGALARLAGQLARPLQQWNRESAARANASAHYDLDDWLFERFLDADRHYSCAYFADPAMDLDAAQQAKCDLIRRKLYLRPGDRVLDIGCGWGGLAMHLARAEGVSVVGLTLSAEQQRVAQERVRRAGLADRVEIRLQDYREVEEPFERVVSVGMFEHVGVPYYPTYFSRVRDVLTEDGVALIHTIARYPPPGVTNPWIRRYIFPGGYIPALSEVLAAVEEIGGLLTTDIEILRLHYARTLAHWQSRFQAVRPEVAERKGERFCRMWEFYLAVSEAAFRWRGMMVAQFQFARSLEALPLTRDYLYRDEVGAGRLRAVSQ